MSRRFGFGIGFGRQRSRAGDDGVDARDQRLAGALTAQRGAGGRADDAVDAQPAGCWKLRTAASVSAPKTPSTLTAPSACCSSCTWRPSAPSVRTITCSVVVAVRAGRGRPLRRAAGEARRRPDGQRGERAERDALGARAGGHEMQLGGAAAGAGTAERELPGLLVGEVARLSRAARVQQQRRARRCGRRGEVGAACARATGKRALQRGAPVVGNCKITRASRHARRPFSIPFCAYGVSCRARVSVYATPHVWRFAPAASRLHWVPRSWAPWGRGLGTNGRQPNRNLCNLRYSGRDAWKACRRRNACGAARHRRTLVSSLS